MNFLSHFLKSILVLAIISGNRNLSAQQISKVNLLELTDKIIVPSNTLDEAYKKCELIKNKCSAKTIYHSQLSEIENLIKANSVQQVHQQEADNVKDKNPNAVSPPSQATLIFARQMQDPVFKAQFDKLTPKQKVEYMKDHQVVLPQFHNSTNNDPSIQIAQKTLMDKMRDPSFRDEWNKKSPQEQDDYVKKIVNENNTAKVESTELKNTDQLMLTTILPISSKANNDLHIFMDQHIKNWKKLSAKNKAIHDKITATASLEIKKISLTKDSKNAIKLKEIQVAAMKKQVQQAQEDLNNYKAFWEGSRDRIRLIITPLDSSLSKINYGDAVVNQNEQKQLPTLSAYQTYALNCIQSMMLESKMITENAANWVYRNKLFEQGKHLPAKK